MPSSGQRRLSLGGTMKELRDRFNDCHVFLVKPPGRPAFLGATPERLVSLSGSRLTTTALAGTRPRGATSAEDAKLAKDLLSASKDREEHLLVVQEIESVLNPLSSRVAIPSTPVVRQLRNVQHLETPISADLHPDFAGDLLEILGRLHPTPALGGSPRELALDWIQGNEGWDRGWYAAPLGWVDQDGDGEFIVGIRSALVSNHTSWLFSGCGIVSESIPESEWEETNAKLKAIADALRYDV
uniref:isochorismate synthase n=2 Tax=Lotharella globosa TaxID=91324 RepID=A0A7S3YTZ6_9EUKA|mmetsp:Transcript_9028/g.17646  ORF Transcript_9028/g.17646 Transcript_9028/m.17646 type:complete len:242 (+) Transcript_9028:136-861(+)